MEILFEVVIYIQIRKMSIFILSRAFLDRKHTIIEKSINLINMMEFPSLVTPNENQ